MPIKRKWPKGYTVKAETTPDGLGRIRFLVDWMQGERKRGQVFFCTPEALHANLSQQRLPASRG